MSSAFHGLNGYISCFLGGGFYDELVFNTSILHLHSISVATSLSHGVIEIRIVTHWTDLLIQYSLLAPGSLENLTKWGIFFNRTQQVKFVVVGWVLENNLGSNDESQSCALLLAMGHLLRSGELYHDGNNFYAVFAVLCAKTAIIVDIVQSFLIHMRCQIQIHFF